MTRHEQYMELALAEARKAYDRGEVPVGAVVVAGGQVVARAHNRTVELHDPTAHAELLALRRAAEVADDLRNAESSLYVTLEPCPMCAGAVVLARCRQLFYGAFDVKAGAAGTLYSITSDKRLNHTVETYGGILDAECGALLERFFRERRREAGYISSLSEKGGEP